MGLPIKENKSLFPLNYDDDAECILDQDANDFEFILKRLNTTWGLKCILTKQNL
jgi:hypothetical protein